MDNDLYRNPAILFLILVVVIGFGFAYILLAAVFMSLGLWYFGGPMIVVLLAGIGTYMIRSY